MRVAGSQSENRDPQWNAGGTDGWVPLGRHGCTKGADLQGPMRASGEIVGRMR